MNRPGTGGCGNLAAAQFILWRSEGLEVGKYRAEALLILLLDLGARALALHSGTNKFIRNEIESKWNVDSQPCREP